MRKNKENELVFSWDSYKAALLAAGIFYLPNLFFYLELYAFLSYFFSGTLVLYALSDFFFGIKKILVQNDQILFWKGIFSKSDDLPFSHIRGIDIESNKGKIQAIYQLCFDAFTPTQRKEITQIILYKKNGKRIVIPKFRFKEEHFFTFLTYLQSVYLENTPDEFEKNSFLIAKCSFYIQKDNNLLENLEKTLQESQKKHFSEANQSIATEISKNAQENMEITYVRIQYYKKILAQLQDLHAHYLERKKLANLIGQLEKLQHQNLESQNNSQLSHQSHVLEQLYELTDHVHSSQNTDKLTILKTYLEVFGQVEHLQSLNNELRNE